MPNDTDWFVQAERHCGEALDVRPLLARGQDPFARVMEASDRVEPGAFLILDAPFDPAPLRRVLAGKGFTSLGREVAPGHWRICFRRDGGEEAGAAAGPAAPVRLPGETWREGHVTHIDLRGLAPPGPLTAVLRLVDGGEAEMIMVHHDRDPALLYPELEARGWECMARQNHGDEIRLILRPARTAP
ncbi:DUF2249 domain-containing protein [Azospirillum halopraeferens]|uniref:DUF2249 domain-containing protein n=1 Tax=Azospirillum halopraeferens TaxID=34010 RepID=UPI000408C617|nr:DUF2249 domain-containing protein [Azospirillum halopraeferens]